MNYNNFLRFAVMIALMVGIVHGIGQAAGADESETINVTDGSAYGGTVTKNGDHFTVTGGATSNGMSVNTVPYEGADDDTVTVAAKNNETITGMVLTISYLENGASVSPITATYGNESVNGTVSDSTVTFSGLNASSAVTIQRSSDTDFRFSSITIYYTEGTSESTYTITIPSTLTVSNTGWNALDGGISADLSLASGQKLIVTASSANGFNFVNSDDNNAKVAYYFLESGDANTAYVSSDAQTSWDFTASEKKNIGIVIENYEANTALPSGTYKETVTFTASVKNSATALTSSTTAWEDGVTYAAASDVTISGVTVTGTVGLVLNEGVTLTVNNSMTVNSGATLTIEGSGTMNINGSPAIDGSGTVVVNGGSITATGSNGSNGSSGDFADDGGNGGDAVAASLTVNSGTVRIFGGNGGNGGSNMSSGGSGGNGGAGGSAVTASLTVNGGTVTVSGGIGGYGSDGEMNGGGGGTGGSAVTSSLTVNGGSVTVSGGNGGNGGNGGDAAEKGGGGGTGGSAVTASLTVSAGTVTASGGSGGNGGIGESSGSSGSAGKGVTGTLTATGMTIQGSSDNSTWSDASSSYTQYRYVKVEEVK